MNDDRVAHWLKRTSTTRVPRRIVCIDSEAKITRWKTGERHDFRLACGSFDILDDDRKPTGRTKRIRAETPRQLWEWVAGCTAKGARTMVFAHNIGYDLRLTNGLEILPDLGYELRGLALTSYSCWARFAGAGRGITLADTSSWLRGSLDSIAGELGMPTRRLPPWNAPPESWYQRCESDVNALRAVVLELLRFVVDERLGDFRLTGAAQGSAAFRARFLKPSKLLVHDDAEALDVERRAAWTGRCELWRHGRVDGAVYEYDFDAAYCRVAAADTVPGRLLGGHTPLPPARFEAATSEMAILSQVTVTTSTPTVPADLDGGIVWPVGTFVTTLWDPEVRLARAYGADVATSWCWLYERTDALQEWAAWVLAALAGAPPGDHPIRRAVMKGWSRSLIGRFGLRYQDLDEIARADDSKIVMFPVRDAGSGQALTWLQVGRQLYARTGMVETADSLPQITSYVMSAARARLWAALDAVGLDRVLYVDTDGFLSTATPAALEAVLGPHGRFPDLRRKGLWPGAMLRSPRNIDVGAERRIAGVPRRAAEVAANKFEYQAWETLPGSLRRARSDRVIVTERRAEVSGHDPRRRHVDGGRTEPLRLRVVDGVNVLAD